MKRTWTAVPMVVLTVILALTGAGANTSRYAGTYRGMAEGEVIHVQVEGDGTLTLVMLADGGSVTVNLEDAGPLGLVGVTAAGVLIGIGGEPGRLTLVVGQQAVGLTPIRPEQFGRPETPSGSSAAGPSGGAGTAATPPGAPPPDPSIARSPWAGRRFSNAVTRSGYGESRTLVLCADGTFAYRFASQSASPLGTHADETTDEGTWSQRPRGRDTVIVLRSTKGETTERLFEPVAPDVVSIDGRRSLIQDVRC